MKTNTLFLAVLSVSLLFILLFSCKQNNSTETPLSTVVDSVKKQPLHIDTFTTSPEVDSCSCFFATDSSAYQSQAYVCAYDLSTLAFMKINGIMTQFTQTEYNGVGNGSVTKFKSDLYELLLETRDAKEFNAASTIQSGSMRVTNKEGLTVIIPFYGLCGCKNPSSTNPSKQKR
jgi:hypothetical protein